jgi:phosphoglycerate dehydrogenase-like enzyme
MILANFFFSTILHSQGQAKMKFPPAARKMDTLNDLLAASDLISLHCALTNETMQIISAECLQHVKPGMHLFIYILGIFL